jgi:oligoendopeptidase F
MAPIRYWLDDRRELTRKKMPAEMESLAVDLSVSGFHAWNQLYDRMAGDLRVDFEEDGKTSTLSLGQLATKMGAPDRSARKQAFEKMTGAWKSREDLAAMILNALGGFRLALYGRRNWQSPLFETLSQSRLRQESLDAMWSVIAHESHKLQPYLDAKMKLLGIDKFRWYDEFAPCGESERLIPYNEAADFVVKHVSEFSGHMGEFSRMAIDKRWIEAEDRPGKAGGGYCTGTGPFRQSRIFMTYAGSYENLLTLAHELGHAYHSYVLKAKPFLATRYSKPLAETASIFNELLVTDAALKASNDVQEKLMLLDQKLQQPYIMFCDIHCRYIFDRAFHDERRKGIVAKDRLCELMVDAQKKAYGSLLDESGHHPLFWASKMHFYLSDEPFYNYPYTFGYLFAGGVYDRAKKEGPAFAAKYQALLADTGSMSTEDVARKHLGVDLTKDDFWKDAVARSLSDVNEYMTVSRSAKE